MEKETADVLAESREYLEEHGWIKDEMTDGDGRVCSLGAVYASQGFEGNVLAIHEPTILAAALYKDQGRRTDDMSILVSRINKLA